ncbi:hypothetical protein V1264_021179 [Littorina saxatilis]|uniref:Uncharacterized protein n=1 Tax=Littorina saxatilis TaxID=31220 RepID=A0AAN9BD91_9CAEN
MFSGSRCEKAVSVCDSSPCKDGFLCKADGPTTYRCVCQNGWDLPDCKPACRAKQTVSSKKGRFAWPQVFAGETAIVTCPYGGGSDVSNATRKCDSLGLNDAVWGKLDDGDCSELGLLEASRRLNALNDLTSNPASLGNDHLSNYTSILEELYVYTLMDTDVASVMMNVVSNLADVNVSVTVASNQGNQTSERLLMMLDNYTADVNVTKGANVSIVSPNFEVAAISVDNTSSSFTFTPTVTVDNSTTKMDVSITIPPEAFAENQTEVTSNRKPTRLQMIGHRKSQLFIPNNSSYGESYLEQQPVLSATVTGRDIVNLSSPVVYKIRNLKPKSNYTCVFWDPENRTWSTEGVITTIKSGNSTVCESFHLTSFAVLLDPSPDFALDTVHEQVLTYISYIGSAVSLFCLTLTIITYGLFRSLNKDKSGKILLNLCVALLLLNAIFLASGLASSDDDDDGLDDNDDACTTVAVILHYLLLASLAWMLVEAAEMYRALVTVFAKYAQCYMLKRCLIGWGVPIVIVAITLGVDTANYKSDGAFCFISRSNPGAYYGALVAPACLVLLVNTVIFIMVTRVILKPRFQQQTQKESEGITPSQVRGAFTVMFLLGVTWVFGPLAINEAKVVFNYLFCILNSLQGFLIFVFRCVFNPEVRLCWLQLIKTGTLKKRRGPIRSAVYSDSSSKADGKSGVYPNGGSHRGSAFGGSDGTSTMKSSLMHSNGWHPKLNGFSGNGQVLERRGTKFSTVDFYQNSTPPESSSPESGGSRKRQHNPITEDERYGDGGGDFTNEGPIFSSTMDYYETGHDGRGYNSAARPVDYDEGEFHGDGGVMDYYESIRTNRKEEPGHVEGEDQKEPGPDPEQPERERRGSSKSSSEKRSSTLRNEQDELTYL